MTGPEILTVILIAFALACGVALPAATMARLDLKAGTVPTSRRQVVTAGLGLLMALLLVLVGLSPGPKWMSWSAGIGAVITCLTLLLIGHLARSRFVEVVIFQRDMSGAIVHGSAGAVRPGDPQPHVRDGRDQSPGRLTAGLRSLRGSAEILVSRYALLPVSAVALWTVSRALSAKSLSVWVSTLGLLLLGWALASIKSWIPKSYGEVMDQLRKSLTAGEKDAFFGAEYFSYLGVIGGIIGIACWLTELAGFTRQPGAPPATALWTLPIASCAIAYVLLLAVTRAMLGEAGRWVGASLAVGLTVALGVLQSAMGFTPYWLAYSLLAWLVSAAGMLICNHLLQLDRRPWRTARTARAAAYLLPFLFFLHYYLRTMDLNRASRPTLTDQFSFLCIIGLLFLTGTVLVTWLDTRDERCLTDQTPTFNALHNGVLLIGVLAISFILLQLLPERPDLESFAMSLNLIFILIPLVLAVFYFSSKNFQKHVVDVPPVVQGLADSHRQQWERTLAVWRVAQVSLLAVVAAAPVLFFLQVMLF